MTFEQLLEDKYFSLMVLFSHLAIYHVIYFSPNCPSTCPKLILHFCITFEAALNLPEGTAPTTVFHSSSIMLFQVTSNLRTFISVALKEVTSLPECLSYVLMT